ncbi:hypothetical protein SAMN05660463_02438 [Pseudomonas sp. URIL14HWK12:I9]|nr:hypothetical protein F474_03461 [Pseudomonas sp. URIL14HWK12:I12]PVZ23193.1 hypothetical protein F470_02742 [Pseudomonas sp. URIL14HWK12:I10]PVZ32522.1 hypothetical protein F472_03089 [Pseudomonas sp. URIL14HWK12:I11]SNZ13592.1 hypothetical protein SAMN05660463_02438 [Pseudomonas sp. URIL14HWK12:I9]
MAMKTHFNTKPSLLAVYSTNAYFHSMRSTHDTKTPCDG